MVGIDVMQIERMERAASDPHFVRGVFTEAEIAYYESRGSRAETLAGMFCAKEAVAKSLGCGFDGFRPSDVEIAHDESGAPSIKLHGGACDLGKGKIFHVSISHDGNVAAAICIAEKKL